MSLVQFMDLFPTEEAAHDWFVEQRWGKAGRHCPRCGSVETKPSARQFTFWCPDCKQRFSVRTGTLMEESRLPLRKWAIAIYMHLTNLKGVSSMKLHRDIGVTQKTAWFMLQRIRKAWENDDDDDWPFRGGRGRRGLYRRPAGEYAEGEAQDAQGPRTGRQIGCRGARRIARPTR